MIYNFKYNNLDNSYDIHLNVFHLIICSIYLFSFVVKSVCLKQFNQIAYRTTKTTIKCDYEGDNKPFFFCKDNNSVCENMVESPQQSNSRFTFTKTNRNFILSISNVSSQDEGVYWCGVKFKKEVVLQKIQLNVERE